MTPGDLGTVQCFTPPRKLTMRSDLAWSPSLPCHSILLYFMACIYLFRKAWRNLLQPNVYFLNLVIEGISKSIQIGSRLESCLGKCLAPSGQGLKFFLTLIKKTVHSTFPFHSFMD